MLRAPFLSILALLSVAAPAIAGPLLGDDVATCRERQNDVKVRQDACERVIASGQAQPKDLAVALAVRAEGLVNRDFDKAIATFNDAIKTDPENLEIVVARGWAYQGKGQDDLAMADYNLALQKRPNFAAAYNDRGTLYLRKGALQSALDDFSSAIKYAPTGVVAYTNRARVETMNRDYDARARGFRQGAGDRCQRAADLHQSLCHLHGDGQIRRSARRLQQRDREDAEKPVCHCEPWRCLSGQRQPGCGAQGLQHGSQRLPEQCACACGAGSTVRTAARPGAGARRLSFGGLRAVAI